jgi:hypothetical protein
MNCNEYECPECGEWVSVELPAPAQVKCTNPECNLMLSVDVDAEFDENGWHDRTTLSVAAQNDSGVILDAARAL